MRAIVLLILIVFLSSCDMHNKSYEVVNQKQFHKKMDTIVKDSVIYSALPDTVYENKVDTVYNDSTISYQDVELPYFINVFDSTTLGAMRDTPVVYFKRYIPDIYYYPDNKGLPPSDEKQGLTQVGLVVGGDMTMSIQSFNGWDSRQVGLEGFALRRQTLSGAQTMLSRISDTSFIKYVRIYNPVAKEYDHIFRQYRPGRNFPTAYKNIFGIGFYLPEGWNVAIQPIFNHVGAKKSRFFHRLIYDSTRGFNDKTPHYLYTYPSCAIESLAPDMNRWRQGEFRLFFIPERSIPSYDYTISILLNKENSLGELVTQMKYNLHIKVLEQ